MLAFGHAGVGAIVGVGVVTLAASTLPLTLSLPLALVAGIISHYVADRVPHGHYEFAPQHATKKMILLFLADFGLGMGILFCAALYKFGFTPPLFIISLAMIGAQLPDVWEGFINLKLIPMSNFARHHRHFHFVIMHEKTPSHKTFSDGVTRKWSILDCWQIAVYLGALSLVITSL